jgi:hypothetical protein
VRPVCEQARLKFRDIVSLKALPYPAIKIQKRLALPESSWGLRLRCGGRWTAVGSAAGRSACRFSCLVPCWLPANVHPPHRCFQGAHSYLWHAPIPTYSNRHAHTHPHTH